MLKSISTTSFDAKDTVWAAIDCFCKVVNAVLIVASVSILRR